MFTGIIEELGIVESLERGPAGARLRVRCGQVLSDLSPGASLAVNGACLTAVETAGAVFAADLSPETLRRTNLGDLGPQSRVNLERPLRLADRLSGHIVQGHVDGTGELVALDPAGDGSWWLEVRPPAEIERYLVYKGSIAIDGISLTIASLDPGRLGLAIIPHTYQNTTLAFHRPGDRLNLECDLIAKHVEKLLETMNLH